jgi:hypothetical protein
VLAVLLLLDVELEDGCAFTIIADRYNEKAHRAIMKNKHAKILLSLALFITFFVIELAILFSISIISEAKNKRSKCF